MIVGCTGWDNALWPIQQTLGSGNANEKTSMKNPKKASGILKNAHLYCGIFTPFRKQLRKKKEKCLNCRRRMQIAFRIFSSWLKLNELHAEYYFFRSFCPWSWLLTVQKNPAMSPNKMLCDWWFRRKNQREGEDFSRALDQPLSESNFQGNNLFL